MESLVQNLCLTVAICLSIGTHQAVSTPCYRNTTSCVPVNSTTCLTAKITFTHTSTEFLNDTLSLSEIQVELEIWSLLKGVPECWAVIQPFLCSVYQPKCDSGEQHVERPSRELCERVRGPCEVVKRFNGSWPWFLQCEQEFYAESCDQTFFEQTSFDTVGHCNSPLIATMDESNWFDQIKGCGVQCTNPLYTETEHNVAHVFVAVMCSICLLCTLFTLVTFIIDWKVGRKYPAVILFFINGCFFLASLGWMAQFIDREDVVCRKDGTVRQGEPMIGSGESASCTVVFITIYYFMLAGVVWLVMLTYSWDITFKAIGTVRDDLSRKTAYFHIICWCLPLVLTIVVLSISEIDGDSMSGVCFPGFYNNWVRTGFVLAPIGLVLTIGTVFSVRGLITLIKVRKDTPPFISDKATAKIKETIVRLIVFIILSFVLVFISAGIHIYNFASKPGWEDSLSDYLYCKANVTVMAVLNNQTESECELASRPSIVAILLHVLAFFGAGISMSSWTWNKSSKEAWERLYRKLCNKPDNKPVKMRKHRIVAKTFKRRKKRNNERLSISYGTDHDDPMGMKFDRSSRSSQSLSSGFAVAMPKHRHRRGQLVRPGTGVIRRYSDSDLASLHSRRSSRRVSSRSSRHDSYESSMSQKLSDIEREIRREERRKRRVKRRKKRQNRIQPILEPISSTMAAMQAQRMRHMRDRHRYSDSSDGSKTSAGGVNLALAEMNHNMPVDSSTFLSDSVMTGNSISELELPQTHQHHLPDFSIFTANTMLPPPENKGDHSNGHPQNLKKGANPSPSGSFRRGRRREVKLEMTETSFYQEDDDNIEMGGNQTIHREENCEESGEIRQNLKELGPLVNEIFERARANSGSGRSANGRGSNQRDPMGSSRLGSASSRGSKGSRGSQTVPKEQFRYANFKVNLPDKPTHEPSRGNKGRPFSGDYVLVGRHNDLRADSEVRKSRSQPTSASSHKRQIGHNGRLGFENGLSWSRFLQGKTCNQGEIFTKPQYYHKGQRSNYLPIMDKSHFMNQMQPPSQAIDVLNVEEEHRRYSSDDQNGQVDVLNVEQERLKQDMSEYNDCENHYDNRVNVLDIEGEHQHQLLQRGESDPYSANINLSHVNYSDEEKQKLKQKQKSKRNTSNRSKAENNVNVLNLDEERRKHSNQRLTSDENKRKRSDVLKLDAERRKQSNPRGTSEEDQRKHSDKCKAEELQRKHPNQRLTLDEDTRNKYSNKLTLDEEHRKHSKQKQKLDEKANYSKQDLKHAKEDHRLYPKDKKSNRNYFHNGDDHSRQGKDSKQHVSNRTRGSDANTKHGYQSRQVQYDGIGPGSASTVSSGYDQRLEESTIVPGNEGNLNVLNLVDYEIDSEYDDLTDDLLTDTYTYTSYDDDLTEVSSLPC